MDVEKFYRALAEIIAAREGVTVAVKEIKKAADGTSTCGNAKRHLEQLAV
ncbi:hypothetical protein [Phascolarctobacterium sp.]